MAGELGGRGAGCLRPGAAVVVGAMGVIGAGVGGGGVDDGGGGAGPFSFFGAC